MQACAGPRLLPLLVAVAALVLLPGSTAELNAAGQPLMTPTAAVAGNRSYLFELPVAPVGVLVMLHRCGRNAEDFWPPSLVCPQCIGMPEAVSISRQALARGYALLAINSANRTVGSAGRCFSWASDAFPIRDITLAFQKEHGLTAAPLYFTGCSSGGSLALRIPSIMAVDGVMAVAIGLELAAFPPANPWPENYTYPPAAYVHFSRDETISRQVDALLVASSDAKLAAGEVEVAPSPVTPTFFSQRDAMISSELSTELHGALQNQLRVLDADGYLTEDWLERVTPQELQAALLPLIQASLSGDGGGTVAAASLGSGGTALLVTEQASALVLYQHVQEELAVAWGEHTNLGDYATAWLTWLEGDAAGGFESVAKALKVVEPAALAAAVDGVLEAESPALPPAPSAAPCRVAWRAAVAASAAVAGLLLA